MGPCIPAYFGMGLASVVALARAAVALALARANVAGATAGATTTAKPTWKEAGCGPTNTDGESQEQQAKQQCSQGQLAFPASKAISDCYCNAKGGCHSSGSFPFCLVTPYSPEHCSCDICYVVNLSCCCLFSVSFGGLCRVWHSWHRLCHILLLLLVQWFPW